MPVEFKDNLVIKTFDSDIETKRICDLYNSFSHHVQARTQGNQLIYKYVKGETLGTILNETQRVREVMKNLGVILRSIHFEDYQITPSYDAVCKSRNLFPDFSKFITSNQYMSRIHGDLNTQNIIISKDNQITFIDRMSDRGDIMFDFTFIMSILCRYLITKEIDYKLMITDFFSEYSKGIRDKKDFFTSFRNNFMGYGYFVYNDDLHRKDFTEWSEGEKIAQGLSEVDTFLNYLDII